jgi:adenine/guanine/hypoxanthine permease
MDVSAVLFATVVASGLSTLLMGLWARVPFALAPGLEMNGFFAFVVVGTLGLSWQQALGAVFWSGILCIILTAIPARQKIIDAIPDNLKKNIAVSVGVFVVATGMRLAGIIEFENGLPSGIGSFFSAKAGALYIGLAVAVILGWKRLKFVGGMLVAIIVAAVFCKLQGITVASPAKFSGDMLAAVFQLDWLSIFMDPRILPSFLETLSEEHLYKQVKFSVL